MTEQEIEDAVEQEKSAQEQTVTLDKVRAAGVVYQVMPENYKIGVEDVMNRTVPVVDCQYFVTNLLQLQGEMEKDYSNLDSFVILMVLEGNCTLNWENGTVFVIQGECVLIPNLIKKVAIRAEKYCKLLEVYCQIEEN